jgi:UDP-N-acetylglucosamine acyltransferase
MNCFIHPTARISPEATIKYGAWIGPGVTIERDVVIGHYSVVGGPPEHSRFYDDHDGEKTHGVHISEGSRIFEFVTIQAGTERPTFLHCGAAVFQHSHVSHDCTVGREATICGRGSIAGFVEVGAHAMLGAHSIVHQHCVIGAYSMVGMASVIKAHVAPGQLWAGYPGKWIGINEVGLRRAMLTLDDCLAIYAGDFRERVGASKL